MCSAWRLRASGAKCRYCHSITSSGTAPTFPKDNLIANNHMHEIGVYGKQTSCYFQALGQHNTVKDNLCYNGPRAGINWNGP